MVFFHYYYYYYYCLSLYLLSKKLDYVDVYITVYAILMLNTDLHNSAVRKKMQKQQFVVSMSGCGSLSPHELEKVYDDILSNPLRLNLN
jgi:Sec7-like guanine-nucleotide exchange factor